jgi:hypothetical protein
MTTTRHAPRFSVILPTHDRRELLREAIASVARQTFPRLGTDRRRRRLPCNPLRQDELRRLGRPQCPAAQPFPVAAAAPAPRAPAAGAGAGPKCWPILDDDDLWDPAYLERADRALRAAPEVQGAVHGREVVRRTRQPSGQEAQDRGMRASSSERTPFPAGRARPEPLRRRRAVPGAAETRVPMPFQRPVTYPRRLLWPSAATDPTACCGTATGPCAPPSTASAPCWTNPCTCNAPPARAIPPRAAAPWSTPAPTWRSRNPCYATPPWPTALAAGNWSRGPCTETGRAMHGNCCQQGEKAGSGAKPYAMPQNIGISLELIKMWMKAGFF